MRPIQIPTRLRSHSIKKPIEIIDRKPEENANGKSDLQPLIEMQDIYKVYKTNAGEFTALKGVSARFFPGQFVSIIGKSGSGKSTLLNMITGIDRPTSGKILIGETYLQDLTESEFSEWRGRNLGIVFQFFQLLPMLTLKENTILPMDFCNMYTPPERDIRAEELLDLVGLHDFKDKLPAAVSGGQEQCAAIARALANDPPIIVADEPTGNLDSKTADLVLQLIDKLVKQGKTVLVVTHDEAVAQRASRTLVICDGELVDEDISRILPHISHRSMLRLSHEALEIRKEPGENLFFESNELPGLLLVVDGQVEMRSDDGKRQASYESGSVLPGGFIKKNLEARRNFRISNRSSARMKYISTDNLQNIITSSRSFQDYIQKLEAGFDFELSGSREVKLKK
ncbi:ABC transporter ATP-binding protein [Leptolinea tardivitalis]|uniref:ABC transporter ATP-binding protein n=1 Tax=Leptolinea tardivitalis TaxID=229920 RepID=UPI0009D7026B|nr:ABC transporter ATP-binding protein [Leptolinea tardivitalis]GAP21075.1 ABC-type antimicrobial peptide transport system, ATPase component [Leptolinea tardivitalis]